MYKKILAIISSVVLSCSIMPVPVGVTAIENVSPISGDVNGDGVVK
jgi:hypothetical protein